MGAPASLCQRGRPYASETASLLPDARRSAKVAEPLATSPGAAAAATDAVHCPSLSCGTSAALCAAYVFGIFDLYVRIFRRRFAERGSCDVCRMVRVCIALVLVHGARRFSCRADSGEVRPVVPRWAVLMRPRSRSRRRKTKKPFFRIVFSCPCARGAQGPAGWFVVGRPRGVSSSLTRSHHPLRGHILLMPFRNQLRP